MMQKFAANAMSAPGKSPVIGDPSEYGYEYEDVTFAASDRVELSGWLVKGDHDRVIIFSHFGVQGSRSGYTPKGKGPIKAYNKQIVFLNTVQHLVKEGYTILMYDQRNHGNSGKGTNKWITGGVEESKDVIAAVKYITERDEYKDANIGLLSYCQGANATTYAYGAKDGLREFPQIKALIALQPMYSNATFLQAFGFSEKTVKKADEINLGRGGVSLFKSCWPNIKDISVPTMVVQAELDPWTDLNRVKEYYNRLKVEKEIVWVPVIKKRLAMYDYFHHTPDKMLEFFGKYV